MKAKVDADTCIGCEVCVTMCPEVFEMEDALAVAKTNPVPADAETSCKEAMDSCPVEAISIEE